MDTTLAERIAIARKRAGLSQDQLAEAVGAGERTTVSKWENGVVPEGRFMLKLPEALNVSADWLLLGKIGEGESSRPIRQA